MEQYFERIHMLSLSDELPSRIRFMLKDVIDLRYNKVCYAEAKHLMGKSAKYAYGKIIKINKLLCICYVTKYY